MIKSKTYNYISKKLKSLNFEEKGLWDRYTYKFGKFKISLVIKKKPFKNKMKFYFDYYKFPRHPQLRCNFEEKYFDNSKNLIDMYISGIATSSDFKFIERRKKLEKLLKNV